MNKSKLTTLAIAFSLALPGGLVVETQGASAKTLHHAKVVHHPTKAHPKGGKAHAKRAKAHGKRAKAHGKHTRAHAKHTRAHAKRDHHAAKHHAHHATKHRTAVHRSVKDALHLGYQLRGVQLDPVATIALAPGSAGRPV
jgi:hypothetical protein